MSKPRWLRMGGALVGLAVFLAASHFLSPRPVQVLVHLPEGAEPVRSMRVRVLSEKGVEIFKGMNTRPQPGRAVPFTMTLSRDSYRLEAWPEESPRPLNASFTHSGEEALDVVLQP